MARTRIDKAVTPRMWPDMRHEHALGGIVCGVDEAGRGPLAGPVAVAAVVLPAGVTIDGLDDSKRLPARQRDNLFAEICAKAHVAVAFASSVRIDRLNIRGATLWAMREAVHSLPIAVDAALFDGRDVPPGLTCHGRAVVDGDALSQSIAAASIVAKVSRDRLMMRLHEIHPQYGFARHMGYGVPEHLDALRRHGPTIWHRRSFKPIAEALAARADAA